LDDRARRRAVVVEIEGVGSGVMVDERDRQIGA